MWVATKNTKCCATCANWRGARKDKGNAVETEDTHTHGKCTEGVYSSVSEGHCACQGRSCAKYIRW